MTDRRITIFLVAVGLTHIGLALWFATITPYRTAGYLSHSPIPDVGAPDERAHSNYIQSLISGEGFPVLNVDRMQSDPNYRREHYEDHQPPLYYLVAAGWCKIVGVSDVSQRDVGVRLRALNSLFGCATVIGVFFAAYWGFRRADLACTACLFPALLPMNVALSAAVSNDPLLFALLAWTMAIVALAVRNGWTTKLALLAGLLAGLSILTKTTGLAVGPVLLVAIFLPQVKRPTGLQVGVACGALLVVSGPWHLRNQRVYHDPLAAGVFERAFTDTAQKSDIVAIAAADGGNPELSYWTNWVGWWTARSFIGTFGYMDIWLNETGKSATIPGKAPNTLYRLCLAGLAILALGWLRSLREPWAQEARSITILNAVLLLVVVLLFLRFNNQYFQGQARYLYPAIVPLSIAFASGAIEWSKKRTIVGALIVAAWLLSLDIYAGSRLPDEFAKRTDSISAGNGLPSGGVQ